MLVVFGNGEDHADPVTPAELSGLEDATVIHLNLGRDGRDKWASLYQAAGAVKLLLYDLAATTSLRETELKEALGLN